MTASICLRLVACVVEGEWVIGLLGIRPQDLRIFLGKQSLNQYTCTKVRLVVEVDGEYHAQRGRHDARRDRVLGELGWSVLRLVEHEIIQDLDAAIERIVEAAKAR